MVFTLRSSTVYWDVYIDPTYYNASGLAQLSALMPYLDAFTARLKEDFGYDIFPLPNAQARLALVLDPASHGGATGTPLGLTGITIAGDSVINVDFGVPSFWFYILSLHEAVNLWTGTLATSWVWADGSTLWAGTSPFSDACDVLMTAELGFGAVSAAQAARMASDQGVQLFLGLHAEWGWALFKSTFGLTRYFGITDWGVYAEPLRTAILAWFMSWASGAPGAAMLSRVNAATIAASGQAVPDAVYQQAVSMFNMPTALPPGMVTGLAIPLYTYPTDGTWDALVAAKAKHPSVPVMATVNPADGPGGSADPNYATGVKKLQAAKIVVLGYVFTSYGTRPAAACKAQAASYRSWYGVDGIFWDEFANGAGSEAFYSDLTAFVKSLGMAPSVGNPGMEPPSSYLGTVDVQINFENGAMPSAGYSHNYLAYNIASLPASFPRPLWLYITNDNLPNPWDTLPSYLEALLAALDTAPAPPPPPPPPTGPALIIMSPGAGIWTIPSGS